MFLERSRVESKGHVFYGISQLCGPLVAKFSDKNIWNFSRGFEGMTHSNIHLDMIVSINLHVEKIFNVHARLVIKV